MAKNGNFFTEPNLNVDEHQVLIKYRTTMSRLLRSVYPHVAQSDIEAGITYSIQKRFKNANATITNNYLGSTIDTTILEMCDYIAQREPIVTSYGVLFKRHGAVKNPLGDSIDNFLKLRKIHKKEMFKYPKGSEMFEHFNLLQNLDKSILSHLARKTLLQIAKKLLEHPKAHEPIWRVIRNKVMGFYIG